MLFYSKCLHHRGPSVFPNAASCIAIHCFLLCHIFLSGAVDMRNHLYHKYLSFSDFLATFHGSAASRILQAILAR